MREDARSLFRDRLDQATTYDEYVRVLDEATARLERTDRGEIRSGGQSLTDEFQ
jgi:hypothetical protein